MPGWKDEMKVTVLKNHPAYGVTRDGRAWSRWKKNGRKKAMIGKRWKLMKPVKRTIGYLMVTISDVGRKPRGIYIHSLVLEAFKCPRPDGFVSRHLNGRCGDNRNRNLKWGTPVENAQDKRKHGKMVCGVQCHSAKVNEEKVRLIRRLWRNGVSQDTLAQQFGIGQSSISKIIRRKSWRHVRAVRN
mgnify:CR=1 FL=1